MKRFDLIPWLIAFGVSVVLMSTDMYAPTMPSMRVEFGVSEADVLWTVTINSIGYCCISLFIGPLSDAIGRRPILLVSLFGFSLCCVGCTMAPTLSFFSAMRFLQGIFGSSLPITGLAMLADRYEGRKLGSIMAYIGIVITLSFAVAPIIGGFIGEIYGWRSIFLLLGSLSGLAFVAFYFSLSESVKQKTAFRLKVMIDDYQKMISDRTFVLLGLITAMSLAGFFAYVTSSSYLYIEQFKLTPRLFGIVAGMGMTTNAISHVIVGRLVATIGNYRVLKLGMALQAIASILMAIMTGLGITNVFLLVIPIMFFNASLGFTFPPSTTIAIGRYPFAAGSASALMGTSRMAMVALGAWLSGRSYDGTLASISSIMILFSCLVIVSFLWASTDIRRTQEAT